MQVPGFSFDTRLYEGEATLVYAGVRDDDALPVVGKLVVGGLRDLRAELALLEHVAGPGVVEVVGLFESTDGPALVQRRFGQGNLAEALRDGPLEIERALRIGVQLAEILVRIHERRVIHRDLKPANVLVDPASGTVAVADFGIAVELPAGARALPPMDLVGTPAYLSPEQTGRTAEGCDGRTDLYALGVLLYEMLAGERPFAGTDLAALVAAHLSEQPAPLCTRAPAVPPVLGEVVMRLLVKAPAGRYQSARGVASDLARCLAAFGAGGEIPPFELARSDSVPPRRPEHMFARDEEKRVFREAMARTREGPALVVVSGEAGIGKRAFVRERFEEDLGRAVRAVAECREGDRPMAAISDALRAAAKDVLRRDDAEVDAIRNAIAARVGRIGRVVLDLAPEWEHVIGPQPELSPLGPAEARARLQHGLRAFTHALGTESAPFVLWLSRIEHLDPASRSLVEALLAGEEARTLVVTTGVEDGALPGVDAGRTTRIPLGPLPEDAVAQWLVHALDTPGRSAAELASVLHERTGGNPGALVALLDHLVDRAVLVRSDGRFVWTLEEVRAADPPPTLAGHAALRVERLEPGRRALIAALAVGGEGCADGELGVMLEREPEDVLPDLAALEREGLIRAVSGGGFGVAYPAVAAAALGKVGAAATSTLRGLLACHLLETRSDAELAEDPHRVAALLREAEVKLDAVQRRRAAALYDAAANRAIGLAAYDDAAAFFSRGADLLADCDDEPELRFRLDVGLARAWTMVQQYERAAERFAVLCERDLTPEQIGIAYPSRADSYIAAMDRERAVRVGLEGLARLGYAFDEQPPIEAGIGALMRNEARLAEMSVDDHVRLPLARSEGAYAAICIISTLSVPLGLLGWKSLYLLTLETALALHLEHGHTRYYASLLSTHSMLLHSRLGNFDAARSAYDACLAVQEARPAPEIDGRTYLVLHYLIGPWFEPWRACLEPLARGIDLAIEAGDPIFAALSASASITLLSMSGASFERIKGAIEERSAILRADPGAAANAANVLRITTRLSAGEPIEPDDLEPVSAVSRAAGAMRNNAMVNLSLALLVIGHEPQVRAWITEVRETFPEVNPAQPHWATLALVEAILATRDARGGEAGGLVRAREWLDRLRGLEEKTRTQNHAPAIRLIEAEIARAAGEHDRASGLYGRAASLARGAELAPLIAYAMEQRAELAGESGCDDEANLFYREAVIAYRRWGHQTKVRELERARPLLRALELSRAGAPGGTTLGATHGGSLRTSQATAGCTVNETLDIEAVLEVSREISTLLHATDIVRAVLLGIAQNAGAQRVVFVQRDEGDREVVYGLVEESAYRDIGVPVESFAEIPHSVMRLSRRTATPIVIADASADSSHSDDAFVREYGCRSIASVPVFRKGTLGGFVLLENRLVVGAFSPRLVEIAQALVAQAAISLDNASLYENLEGRVRDRTAALAARNAEMQLLFDHVSQGLVMVDREGRLSSERSAILASWFEARVPERLHEMFAHDPMFEMSWEQLIDGLLPPELCIDQLPAELRLGERVLAVSWQPVFDTAGELVRMLVMLSDVTEALLRQEAEREQKELMDVFERFCRDRPGVLEFVTEAQAIVRALATAGEPADVEKRLVHTLKGNAALLGLRSLSTLCHEIESEMQGECRGLDPRDRARIGDGWAVVETKLQRFLHVDRDVMQVRRADFEAIHARLARDGHPAARELELWQHEPLALRFERIGAQACELAARLGKAPLEVQVDAGEIRTESASWAAFWGAFVHVVRNAVDHGVERPEERTALGKGPAVLRLGARCDRDHLVLELADDGRGIAWEKLREKARAAGLPSETSDDLVAALYRDGVSTKDEADEQSGRGVGMAALAQVCDAMGGAIEVDSAPGRGTTWRFVLPAHLARVAAVTGPGDDAARH